MVANNQKRETGMRREAIRVYASVAHAASQHVKPPMLGQALIEYEGAQASLAFDASRT